MAVVSIVVPVHNAEDFILSTVSMVQAQTFEDWELLLIENGSTDDTKEILGELEENTLDKRIKVDFFTCSEKGPAPARNRGVDLATGRYIAFLDADDVWDRHKLEKQISFMEEKDAAFSCTEYEFGNEKAEGTGRFVRVPDVMTYKKALSRTVIFTSTVMLDTDKLGKEMIKMPVVGSEDTATWWKILRSGIMVYGLKESLAIYRRPAKSLSSNKGKAIVRIWNLYRNEEKLNVVASAWYFCGWAVRATLRRI